MYKMENKTTMPLSANTMKVEVEVETCCVCEEMSDELLTPEEYDACAGTGDPPLRAVLLHLNQTKTVPSGRLCPNCIRKALDAYSFCTSLAARGPPSLAEKIRVLRQRLHELTQKIDVFIVVGGGAGGTYNEDDIIMVEKDALAAAARADSQELLRAKSLRGDHCYQCTVCPRTFQRASEYRSHIESHGPGAVHSCWSCGAQFASHAAARAHADEHAAGAGRDRDLTCHLCSVTFQSQVEQRQHESRCPPRCPVAACGATLHSRAALSTHMAAHDTACGVCLRVFPTVPARAAHILSHRQARQFLCGYDGCILRFSTRSNLLSHLRKCHGSEPAPESAAGAAAAPAPAAPVPCDTCDRTFGSVASMKRHARIHKVVTRRVAAQNKEKMEWSGAEEEGEGRVEYLEVETLEELEEAQAIIGDQ